MASASSTASSKRTRWRRRRRGKPPPALAVEDDHDEEHPSAGAAADSAWTDEMHSSFLHNMEAAFVHNILLGCPASAAAAGHAAVNHNHFQSLSSAATTTTTTIPTVRLDRYVPDSAESTRDGHGSAPPASGRTGFGYQEGQESHDDDADQVVPLFRMPQTSDTCAGRGTQIRGGAAGI